jgi:hypothetical protein
MDEGVLRGKFIGVPLALDLKGGVRLRLRRLSGRLTDGNF